LNARVVWLASNRRSREHAVTITHGRSMRSGINQQSIRIDSVLSRSLGGGVGGSGVGDRACGITNNRAARGRGPTGTLTRGRSASLPLEAAAQFNSPETREQTAVLPGSTSRFADRGGRRTGRRFNNRARGCRCTRAPLHVASLGIAYEEQ
jgi:hypothetical protein